MSDVQNCKMDSRRSQWTHMFALFLLVCFQNTLTRAQDYYIGFVYPPEAKESRDALLYYADDFNRSKGHRFRLNANTTKETNMYKFQAAMCKQMKAGVFAFIGISTMPALNTAASYAEKLHMPYVTPAKAGLSEDRRQYVLKIYPEPLDALSEVIKEYDWRTVHYVFDTDEGYLRMQYIDRKLVEKGSSIELIPTKISNITTPYESLRHMDSIQARGSERYIVLDMHTQEALVTLLSKIPAVGMNKIGYHYLLGTVAFNELDLSIFLHGGVNITGFTLLNYEGNAAQRFMDNIWRRKKNRDKIGLEAALTWDAAKVITTALEEMIREDGKVFQGVYRNREFYNNVTRGIPCDGKPWMHGEGIVKKIKGIRTEGITGPITFDRYGNRHNFTLSVTELSLDYRKQIGNWSTQGGLQVGMHIKDHKHQKPKIDHNKTWIVTTILILHGIIDSFCGKSAPNFQDYSKIWDLEEWWELSDQCKNVAKFAVKENWSKDQALKHLEPMGGMKQETVDAIWVRREDIRHTLLENTCAISQAQLKDFDWKMKLAISSDKLANIQQPLVSVDFDVQKDEGRKIVSVEMTKEDLQKMIMSLEAAQKVVTQLKT